MTDSRDQCYARFRLGDAAPAVSQFAQWIGTLGMIYHDMAVTTNRLDELMDTGRGA